MLAPQIDMQHAACLPGFRGYMARPGWLGQPVLVNITTFCILLVYGFVNNALYAGPIADTEVQCAHSTVHRCNMHCTVTQLYLYTTALTCIGTDSRLQSLPWCIVAPAWASFAVIAGHQHMGWHVKPCLDQLCMRHCLHCMPEVLCLQPMLGI